MGDVDGLDRTAGAIRGRSGRICNVVSAEMDNYEPGYYTGRVMEAVKLLLERVMPNFAEKVEAYVHKLTNGLELTQMDQNEFIDAARLVYEGVREIRRAVLLNRGTIGKLGVKVRNMKMDLNIYGTWHRVIVMDRVHE